MCNLHPYKAESLLHWKHDVERREVRSALQRPKFVRKLVDRIMQEKGCVVMLFETSKAILNVPKIRDMSRRNRATSVILTHAISYLERKDGVLADRLTGQVSMQDDPRVLVLELLRFLVKQIKVFALERTTHGDRPEPHYVENMLEMLSCSWMYKEHMLEMLT